MKIRNLIKKKNGHAMSLTLLITMFVTSLVLLVSILVNREINRNTNRVNYQSLKMIAENSMEKIAADLTNNKGLSLQEIFQNQEENYTCKSINNVEYNCVIKSQNDELADSPIEQKFTVHDSGEITDYRVEAGEILKIKLDSYIGRLKITTKNQMDLEIALNYITQDGSAAKKIVLIEPKLKRFDNPDYLTVTLENSKSILEIDLEKFIDTLDSSQLVSLTITPLNSEFHTELISLSANPIENFPLQTRLIDFTLSENDNSSAPIVTLSKQLLLNR